MGKRGEQHMVPKAEFRSYYGKPIINGPVWKTPDVPGYLFLGGLAGGSSLLAAGAHATGRLALARGTKVAALGAAAASGVALVHDLGRPSRFLYMLRTFKTTSPMSVGSWVLAGYSGNAAVAALASLTGRAPRAGAVATGGAALLGPGVAAYTAILLANTAVPAWHEAWRELPFVFVGSGSAAAGGLALLWVDDADEGPARRLATIGWLLDLVSLERMERRLGPVGDAYEQGRAGRYMTAGKVLTAIGAVAVNVGRGRRAARAVGGASLLAGSLCTRFGVFHAGRASAEDPAATVVPQRERVDARTG